MELGHGPPCPSGPCAERAPVHTPRSAKHASNRAGASLRSAYRRQWSEAAATPTTHAGDQDAMRNMRCVFLVSIGCADQRKAAVVGGGVVVDVGLQFCTAEPVRSSLPNLRRCPCSNQGIASMDIDGCLPGSGSPPCSPRGSPRKPSAAAGASPWAIASPSFGELQSALTLTVYWEGTANTIRPVTTQVGLPRAGPHAMAHTSIGPPALVRLHAPWSTLHWSACI